MGFGPAKERRTLLSRRSLSCCELGTLGHRTRTGEGANELPLLQLDTAHQQVPPLALHFPPLAPLSMLPSSPDSPSSSPLSPFASPSPSLRISCAHLPTEIKALIVDHARAADLADLREFARTGDGRSQDGCRWLGTRVNTLFLLNWEMRTLATERLFEVRSAVGAKLGCCQRAG